MTTIIDIEKNNKRHHSGRPITKIEVSPNGKYLVTYSEEDNSIVGWNIEDVNEGQLKPDAEERFEPDKIVTIKTVRVDELRINHICVSDDSKLAYIYSFVDLDKTFI